MALIMPDRFNVKAGFARMKMIPVSRSSIRNSGREVAPILKRSSIRPMA